MPKFDDGESGGGGWETQKKSQVLHSGERECGEVFLGPIMTRIRHSIEKNCIKFSMSSCNFVHFELYVNILEVVVCTS